jgi:hypothetical protein
LNPKQFSADERPHFPAVKPLQQIDEARVAADQDARLVLMQPGKGQAYFLAR